MNESTSAILEQVAQILQADGPLSSQAAQSLQVLEDGVQFNQLVMAVLHLARQCAATHHMLRLKTILYLKRLVRRSYPVLQLSNTTLSTETFTALALFLVQEIGLHHSIPAQTSAAIDILVYLVRHCDEYCPWILSSVQQSFQSMANTDTPSRWVSTLYQVCKALDSQRKEDGGQLLSGYKTGLIEDISSFFLSTDYQIFINQRLGTLEIGVYIRRMFQSLSLVCSDSIPGLLDQSLRDIIQFSARLYDTLQSRGDISAMKACTAIVGFWTCLLEERALELSSENATLWPLLTRGAIMQTGLGDKCDSTHRKLQRAILQFFYLLLLNPACFARWRKQLQQQTQQQQQQQPLNDGMWNTLCELSMAAIRLLPKHQTEVEDSPDEFLSVYPFGIDSLRECGRRLLQALLHVSTREQQLQVWNRATAFCAKSTLDAELWSTLSLTLVLNCSDIRDQILPSIQTMIQTVLKSKQPILASVGALTLMRLAAQVHVPLAIRQDWEETIMYALQPNAPLGLNITACMVVEQWFCSPHVETLNLPARAEVIFQLLLAQIRRPERWHVPLFVETANRLVDYATDRFHNQGSCQYLQHLLDLLPRLLNDSQAHPTFIYAYLELAKTLSDCIPRERLALLQYPVPLQSTRPGVPIPNWCQYAVQALVVTDDVSQQTHRWAVELRAETWRQLTQTLHQPAAQTDQVSDHHAHQRSEALDELEARVDMLVRWIQNSTSQTCDVTSLLTSVLGTCQFLLAHCAHQHLALSILDAILLQPAWSTALLGGLSSVVHMLRLMMRDGGAGRVRPNTYIQLGQVFSAMFIIYDYHTVQSTSNPEEFCSFLQETVLDAMVDSITWETRLRCGEALFKLCFKDMSLIQHAENNPHVRNFYMELLKRADEFAEKLRKLCHLHSQTRNWKWKETQCGARIFALVQAWPDEMLKLFMESPHRVVKEAITSCNQLYDNYYTKYQQAALQGGQQPSAQPMSEF